MSVVEGWLYQTSLPGGRQEQAQFDFDNQHSEFKPHTRL